MSAVWFPKGIRGWVVLIATLLGMALTARLGWWQLDRAAQKEALQAAITQQSAQAVLRNADWSALLAASANPADLPDWLHRPVQLSGRWQAAHTVYLDNRQMHGRPGFYVLTPLLLEGGGAVVVQRGWVPRNFQDRTALPPIDTPQGLVQVVGRIAAAPTQLYALGTEPPADAAASRIRQNLSLPVYAQETGLALPPLSVVQTDAASEGLLRDWPVPDAGVSKHYGYAFQWFGLCALVALLYLWFQILRPLRRASFDAAHAS